MVSGSSSEDEDFVAGLFWNCAVPGARRAAGRGAPQISSGLSFGVAVRVATGTGEELARRHHAVEAVAVVHYDRDAGGRS